MGEKLIVTGGAGFIGSHLVDHLMENGHSVIVIDNLFSGKTSNLERWEGDPDLKFIKGDIRGDLDALLKDEDLSGVSAVFHLAALINVMASIEDPREDASVNLLGTMNVLDLAREHDIDRVLFSSSAAVYGDTDKLPTGEYTPLHPLSPYGIHKMGSEGLTTLYNEKYGMGNAAFRFFNVYGPRQDPSNPYSGVISKFIDRAASGDDLIIFGDGEQTRDFIYVTDVVRILILGWERGAAGIYNVGLGRENTVKDLARHIVGIAASRSRIIHEDPRKGEILRSRADISRIEKDLSFVKEVGLREGLKRTYEWFLR